MAEVGPKDREKRDRSPLEAVDLFCSVSAQLGDQKPRLWRRTTANRP